MATITCSTAGASIYYTTDGSFPWSGNPNATLYTAPFPIPPDDMLGTGGTDEVLGIGDGNILGMPGDPLTGVMIVRAVAYKSGLAASPLVEKIVT